MENYVKLPTEQEMLDFGLVRFVKDNGMVYWGPPDHSDMMVPNIMLGEWVAVSDDEYIELDFGGVYFGCYLSEIPYTEWEYRNCIGE
jgi:hypothetical protein